MRSPQRSASLELLEQGAGAGRGLVTGEAVQPAEVDDLVAHRHPGVEAALLRHVPPPAAILLVDPAGEEHLTPDRAQHTEHDPHQRRLAGAVRSEQPGEHGRRVQAHPSSRATRSPNA